MIVVCKGHRRREEVMNYRLIQHYTNKFPPEYRRDLFQEGCLAVLDGKDIYCHMVSYLRWWTKYRRRDNENQFVHVSCDDLKFEYDPIEDIYLKEMLPRLNAAVSKLKPCWQKIIRWRYWDDLSMKQIGEITGTSESNISYLNKKIINKLRREVEMPVNKKAWSQVRHSQLQATPGSKEGETPRRIGYTDRP